MVLREKVKSTRGEIKNVKGEMKDYGERTGTRS